MTLGHDRLTRRDLFQVATAAGALLATHATGNAQGTRGSVRQDDLLAFDALGQVTLLHMTDCHAQLQPIFFREPSTNIGVGAARGLAPHISDRKFLEAYALEPGSHRAYAMSSADHTRLARAWGRVGGMDRMATLVQAIRAERGAERVLFLDGGDALQGSYTALATRGGDMVRTLDALGVDATTGHWEFTYGAARVAELFGGRGRSGVSRMAFLAGNVFDTDFDEPIFDARRIFIRGGVKIAVIGQAFPYTPIANPRWMIPQWSFGIREGNLHRNVTRARANGADIVVLLSHNGFDVDRKLAARVPGIDVILSGHTHDALPEAVVVGSTLIIASGSHGKFLSRLDLDVRAGRIAGYRYALIPVLADVIAPHPGIAALVADVRRPHEALLATELGETSSELYRRDNFGGPLDDVILDAMLTERGAEIAFSPGFRWGATILPGKITWEDVYNATAITYPACYRTHLKGDQIKAILEDVADNLLNPDPYYQQGGDMVRVAGMSYRLDIDAPSGSRISEMTGPRGLPMQATKSYAVAGWGSINPAVEGPPIWDVVAAYLSRKKTVTGRARAPGEPSASEDFRFGRSTKL